MEILANGDIRFINGKAAALTPEMAIKLPLRLAVRRKCGSLNPNAAGVWQAENVDVSPTAPSLITQ